MSQGRIGEGEPQSTRQVALAWPRDLSEQTIEYANQFMVQLDPDGNTVYLTIGVVTPPVILGDEAQRQEQIASIDSVPIRAMARYALSRENLDKLVGLYKELPSAEQVRNLVKEGQ